MANVGNKDRFAAFLQTLSRSGLLPEEQINRQVEMFGKAWPSHAVNPLALTILITQLVTTGQLTCWQCQKLRDGRFKGFFLDDFVLLDHLDTDEARSYYLVRHLPSGCLAAIAVTPLGRGEMRDAIPYEVIWREGSL